MYYKGVYHLFYQYNPYSAIWGNMTWGHSVSYDLVNWINLEFALLPSETYDLGGCFSGSVTFLQRNKPAILYTGVDIDNFQSQNIAFPKDPSDPFLREWYKSSHNPVISANDYGDIDPSSFRDPTTAWQSTDGTWQVIVGGKIAGRGLAFLYQSKDFVSWTRSDKPFHSSRRTGMLECPDFFPVCVKGLYKDEADGFEVETYDFMEGTVDLRYDYGGKFYASKSFFDGGKKRQILCGWVKEATNQADDVKKGWSGLQSIPRVLWLSRSGNQLMQWPIHEIESLRKEKVEIQEKELKSGSLVNIVGITASQADVEVSFEVPDLEEAELMEPSWVDPQLLCAEKSEVVEGKVGPFGLLVLASQNLTEQTAIFFRVFKNDSSRYVVLMCTDLSRSSVRKEVDKTSFGAFVDINPLQENIRLRILIDHSIVESFGGGGKTCITNRVYPVLAVGKDAELNVFNKGKCSIKMSELKAWSMKEAKVVPFTKRRKPPTKG
ncbi:beta-fructofuranosidase, insoluble isoenzyme CWINV3-like isoform X1 [Silene latifolia]|uniref:beta-fructofuranosidase, insoluble isoenzyme CWINV3-like isoform X1 n=1 Tax=Silene latifolia TaxID=37657 RepID=UPI003D76E635